MTEDSRTVRDVLVSKKKVSVNFKLAVVIIMAGVISVGAFLLMGLIEAQIVRNIGASESVKTESVNDRFESLNEDGSLIQQGPQRKPARTTATARR